MSKTTLRTLREGTLLERCEDFVSSANMTGKNIEGSDYLDISFGRLPYEYRTILSHEMRDNPSTLFYVVFSYLTPIAWKMRGNDSPWRIPPEYYSVVTTRHQNLVKLAARQNVEEPWITSTG